MSSNCFRKLPISVWSMYKLHSHRLHFGKTLLLNRKGNSFATRVSQCAHCRRSGQSTTIAKHCQVSAFKSAAVPQTLFSATSSVFPQRWFTLSSSVMDRLKPEELRRRIDNLTDCFAEARELLGDARESLGSTYFSEDMMEAQEAVSSTIVKYQALLADLDEDQRNDVVRTIGLRMEELKAQEQAIKDLLD